MSNETVNRNVGRVFSLVEQTNAQVNQGLEELAAIIKGANTIEDAEKIIAALVTAIDQQNKALMGTQDVIRQDMQAGRDVVKATMDSIRAEMQALRNSNASTQELLIQILGVLQSPKQLVFDDDGNPIAVQVEFN